MLTPPAIGWKTGSMLYSNPLGVKSLHWIISEFKKPSCSLVKESSPKIGKPKLDPEFGSMLSSNSYKEVPAHVKSRSVP